MNDADIETLLPLYALGALSIEEREAVENFLRGNPEAQEALQEMMETSTLLATLPEPERSADGEKEALMARVRAKRRSQADKRPFRPSRRWQLPIWPVPAFAALGLLTLALSAWLLLLADQLSNQRLLTTNLETQVTELKSALATLETESAGLQAENRALNAATETLQQRLQAQQDVLAFFAEPGTQAIAIAGTDRQPQAGGALLVNVEQGRFLLLASGLAPLPEDQTYQLWLIQDDRPASAGLFTVDDQGHGIVEGALEPDLATFGAVGVSIEPGLGSDQPTGDIVLFAMRSF